MLWKWRKQADFSAEIESHIALEADRLREEGWSAAEAAAMARRRFGNVVRAKECFYEARRALWLEDLQRDFRYGVRQLLHNPGFATTVIITLALGIGATAAIFSVIDAAFIKPLPFPESDRLVSLYERWQGDLDSLAPADYLDYRAQSKSFEDLAAYRTESFNLSGENRPERVLGAVVTPNFFTALKMPAEVGRALDAAQDKPGGARTVVVSDSLWRRRFAGSPAAVGKVILLDGEPRTIVGVMPRYLKFPDEAEIWAAARFQVPEHPLRPQVDPSTSRGSHYFDVIGRLRAGVSLRQAQREAEVISERLKREFKNAEEGDGPAVLSLRDALIGGNARSTLVILLCAVVVLLLIACANVANVMLARSAGRRQEIALRGSLGAGRLRLIRQLLTESFILTLLGTALGLGAAAYAVRSLEALIPLDVLPAGGLHIDLRVIVLAILLSVLSAILCGVVPAFSITGVDVNSELKESGRTALTDGPHANQSRNLLVVTQIALAAVLLTGAGLLMRSFVRLVSAPQPFTADHVLSLQLSLPPAQYGRPGDRIGFTNDVLARIRSIPGVRSAAFTSRLPLNPGGSSRGVQIRGRISAPGADLSPDYLVTTPEYFKTLRIAVLKGRGFSERDNATGPPVAVVNSAMARYFWPGQDPVGQYLKAGSQTKWTRVIGVIADVTQQSLDRAARPALYVPYAQDPWPTLALVVRTAMDPEYAASEISSAVHRVDKDEPIYNVRTMHEVIAASVRARRFRTILLGSFALLALALAAIGIYGVMAYSVAQRTREIGVRVALGAKPSSMHVMILTQGVRLAVFGAIVGLVASFVLTRFLSGVLYGIASNDGVTFAGTFLFLVAIALVASYVPARRATRIDPAAALRV